MLPTIFYGQAGKRYVFRIYLAGKTYSILENHEKNAKQFFSQGEFNSSALYPNDIHILFIPLHNAKNSSHFLKKTFA